MRRDGTQQALQDLVVRLACNRGCRLRPMPCCRIAVINNGCGDSPRPGPSHALEDGLHVDLELAKAGS